MSLTVYNIDELSSFMDKTHDDIDTNIIIEQLKKKFFLNNIEFDTRGQKILTENDLKCLIYKIVLEKPYPNNIQVHSETADKIEIHDEYCIGVTENGDIPIPNSGNIPKTRWTDITITIDGNSENTNSSKNYLLNGNHIDIELKFIRDGFKTTNMKAIRRDLCKLKYLLDPEVSHQNEDEHGVSVFGLFIIGFTKRGVLEKYLNNGLKTYLEEFNKITNVSLLLLFEEE